MLEQNGRQFHMHVFLNDDYYILFQMSLKFVPRIPTHSCWQYVRWLGADGWYVVIYSNVDQNHRRHIAALGHNELSNQWKLKQTASENLTNCMNSIPRHLVISDWKVCKKDMCHLLPNLLSKHFQMALVKAILILWFIDVDCFNGCLVLK